MVLAELSAMGFAIKNPDVLRNADAEYFTQEYRHFVHQLAALRGGDVDYVPLFTGFPDKVPDGNEYFVRRLIGFLINYAGLHPDQDTESGAAFRDGMTVPEWLFDLEEFGADPITQMQNSAAFERGRAAQNRREVDTHVEWMSLEFVFEDELADRLRDWLRSVLYSKSSIAAVLHDDVRALLSEFGIAGMDPEQIGFRETRTLVLEHFWKRENYDVVKALVSTPTDLLRLFASLTGSDVSLAQSIRYPKLNRPQRNVVMAALQDCPALAEDLNRYRSLWLALGRGLHVHEPKNQRQYRKVVRAFELLYDDRLESFDGAVERLMRDRRLGDLLIHLSERPGVFARRLHEVARTFPARGKQVLDAFGDVVDRVPLKNLLTMWRYFATINDLDNRVIVNKAGRIQVIPNTTKGALSTAAVRNIEQSLESWMLGLLAQRESWDEQKIWIDPQLSSVVVPLQQREASDAVLTLGRGSRLRYDATKVLRLFVWWRQNIQRTDLDLSVIQFDANMNPLGHVSYTRLASEGIVHSGDIQSAPKGAAEFIDITLDALPSNVAYIAAQVYRYSGDKFAEMDCRAGYAVREHVNSEYRSFDIKTVANVFPLKGTAAYCLPLIVDLRQQSVVLTDLYMSGSVEYNNVEGAVDDIALVGRELLRFDVLRPTMADLARLHAEARGGELTEEREDADITFGITNCDFNAGDIETVLSELL